MTQDQVLWNIAIGIFLLIVGAVGSPVFKRIWEQIKRPPPLTPQTLGQLTENLAMQKIALDRLNYLDSHPRDLFLYLLQLLFGALMFAFSGALIFLAPIFFVAGKPALPSHAFFFILLLLADIMCFFGFIEGNRMSEKKIQKQKDAFQASIDQITKQLNPPDLP